MEEIDSDKDGFINLEEFAQLCRSTSEGGGGEELREAFDLYDENKDGLVSEAELHHVLNRIGMRCSVEECARMIKGVDSDGDGRVNYKEFEKMMASKKN
ncbi:Probable calcium-binding protein CML27 [Linum grandiflorum]